MFDHKVSSICARQSRGRRPGPEAMGLGNDLKALQRPFFPAPASGRDISARAGGPALRMASRADTTGRFPLENPRAGGPAFRMASRERWSLQRLHVGHQVIQILLRDLIDEVLRHEVVEPLHDMGARFKDGLPDVLVG